MNKCFMETFVIFGGKYHCTDDLLFILFGFSCFAFVDFASALLVWSNPKPVRCTAILPTIVSVLCIW